MENNGCMKIHSMSIWDCNDQFDIITMVSIIDSELKPQNLYHKTQYCVNMTNRTEDYNTFDFDKWIESYDLNEIKQIFVDNDMCNLVTLNFNDKNFASLITDKHIIQRPSLQSTFITSIQSLLAL